MSWEIWGSDGWSFILQGVFGGYGSQTGIGPPRGSMLAYIRALNAAIREENKAERRACWEAGHFVGIAGKCYDDPEEGLQRALNQASKSTTDSVRDKRIAGYIANQFYREWFEAAENEDYDKITSILNKYGEYSDVMTNNVFIGGMSFAAANPQDVLDRAILGDSDWGVTIQMCNPPNVVDNCVDPTDIRDIWEDFGRHAQVIFKGLEIPGLPEWLPFPGIMRLPTIGEIWDTVSGPFQEEAKRQLNECMAGPDGVAGTADDKPASVCYEERDVAGIITEGIKNAGGQIIDATQEKVNEAIGAILEAKDCVTNPTECAGDIKDWVEGVFGSVDPTADGIPPWMKAIIIGGAYGEEILEELEKLFNSDIDDDGEIGVVPDDDSELDTFCKQGYPEGTLTFGLQADQQRWEMECSDNYCRDGTPKPEDGVCPGDEEPWTNEGPTAEDCAKEGKEHIPSNEAQKKDSECGGCLDGFTEIDGQCQEDDDPTENEGPTAEECAEEGRQHIAATDIADSKCGECLPGFEEIEGVCTQKPDDGTPTGPDGIKCEDGYPEGTLTFGLQNQQDWWRNNCANTHCADGSLIPESGVCAGDPVEECQDPNRNVDPNDGSCADTCKDGSPAPASGLCPDPVTECGNKATNYPDCNQCENGTTPDQHVNGDCSQPLIDTDGGIICEDGRPTGQLTFGLQEQQRAWDEKCRDTHCESGVRIEDDPDCYGTVTDPDCSEITDENAEACGKEKCADGSFQDIGTCPDITEECKNGATNYPDCNQCPKGKILSDGMCVAGPDATCDEQNRVTNEDGTCGECKAGYTFDTDQDLCVSTGGEDECANGATDFPACTTCPEGQSMDEEGNCVGGDDDGDDDSGGGGGGGGGGMFQPYTFAITADPAMQTRQQFPITDFLAGIFTNSTGSKKV